jgi:hypothetical protein
MEMILEFMANHPHLSAVLVVIGVFRAVFKPIMTVLEAYVGATESTKDNELLEKIKGSKTYKVLVWLVDYTASIKLPKAK